MKYLKTIHTSEKEFTVLKIELTKYFSFTYSSYEILTPERIEEIDNNVEADAWHDDIYIQMEMTTVNNITCFFYGGGYMTNEHLKELKVFKRFAIFRKLHLLSRNGNNNFNRLKHQYLNAFLGEIYLKILIFFSKESKK